MEAIALTKLRQQQQEQDDKQQGGHRKESGYCARRWSAAGLR